MNASTTTTNWNAIGANLIGILLLVMVVAMIAGIKIPLLSGYRSAIIVLLIVGMTMCALGGIGRVAAVNAWAHPVSILGYIVGVLILVIAGAALLSKPLPFIANERIAFITMAALIGSKWVLTLIHPLIK